MRRLLFLIGFLLPLAASAKETNVYELFRAQVEKEQVVHDIDRPVVQFLQGVYRDRWSLSTEDVQAALLGQPWKACTTGDDPTAQSNRTECGRAIENIQALGVEEQALRTFGRRLQSISAAQELPLTDIPGRPSHLISDLSGITTIWRAGTGSVQQAASGSLLVRTRTLTVDEAAVLRAPFEEIARLLEPGETGVDTEQQNAMVWYFQYGSRLRAGERAPTYPAPVPDPQSGSGSERQYLFTDTFDTSMGQRLHDVWNALPKDRDSFNPPLGESDIAYILFPAELQDLLPENIIVWARIDRAPANATTTPPHPLGDVGLAFVYPIDPLLPSLVHARTQEPIAGGRYPPAPLAPGEGDGRGLCSMGLAKQGYLCRPLTVTRNDQCPDPANPNRSSTSNVLTLISCTVEGARTESVAGADVCQDIAWQGQRDTQRCDVRFVAGTCGGQPASTSAKTSEGTIDVCINEQFTADTDPATRFPVAVLVEHELVHAAQRCSMKPGNPYEGLSTEAADALCCRLEGEAHLVSCTRMTEEGTLTAEDGTPITAERCMEASRISACSTLLQRPVRCATQTPVNGQTLTTMQQAMERAGGPPGLPQTFRDMTDPRTMDVRTAARLRAIEETAPICTPGTETTYKNTIGNNACYLGQCVEESLALHRLTAGRSPATVGDEAFPWDAPTMGTPLATVLRSVPITTPTLPSYRPQMISRILEDALCQLQGLPASTPPHLCAFAASRRLDLPQSDGAATAVGLVWNREEQQDATRLTEQLAAGLGSRIGTDLQGQYLRMGTRTLADVVSLASFLLQDITTVTFPTNMCPLSITP